MEELQPTNDQLSQSMPLTLHSKWAREDFCRRGAYSLDFFCKCESFLGLRRKRWLKESKNP
ncbi:hypothetical protein PMIT1327_00012 [Prochlorococcus marinus str. MIT 1327]|nr:hypothetical protein PMIT1312_00098 [Prochlorococcus marinus str. MIT 1312]KZR85091.1 hypothetical protein PMIT1327_00012 [Prochlorococcus marinus str. MIT 1327]